jgi:hypothetical protein
MKRLLVVALALSALAPATSHAARALPKPGVCLMAPMTAGSCSYTALMNGTVAYAIQGAVEFRITHVGSTTRNCLFGSGGGTGPRVSKGDRVNIIGKTNTTTFLAGLVPSRVKAWTGTGKRWPC